MSAPPADPFPDDAWLAEDPLPADPVAIADAWLAESFAAGLQPNPHAIALATREPDGHPAVRMVLCKEIDVAAGAFVFYTDRASRKGTALAAHAFASLVFHFAPPGRQVRACGPVVDAGDAASDAYFASRPRESQLAAWASRQSRPLASRADLERSLADEAARFGTGPIPRPPDWGGYRVVASEVELWRSRPARLHDRARWMRPLEGDAPGPWHVERLQP